MIEGKGLGNKRVNPVKLSLTNREKNNLTRLAVSCRKEPAVLAREILMLCLDDETFIKKLQDNYCIQKAYRVVPVRHNGEVYFTLTGRDDIEWT